MDTNEESEVKESEVKGNEEFVVAHFNGSSDGWVESGPYVDGWYSTRKEAEEKAKEVKEKARDGWYNRVVVWSQEEYYANK